MRTEADEARRGECGWPCWLALGLGVFALWVGLRWKAHPWMFYDEWGLGVAAVFVLGSVLAAAGIWAAGERWERWQPWVLGAGFAVVQGVCARSAWKVASKVPWGFDHPSFMYRMKEFGDLFPGALGGYSPWWNAGTKHFIKMTSGAHAFGMLV